MKEFALSWHHGEQHLAHIVRRRRLLTIGRHAGCDIVLDPQAIALRHAQMLGEGCYLYLRNLSTNSPIILNGRYRIAFDQITPLQAGDTFCIHPVTFLVSAAVVFKSCCRCWLREAELNAPPLGGFVVRRPGATPASKDGPTSRPVDGLNQDVFGSRKRKLMTSTMPLQTAHG